MATFAQYYYRIHEHDSRRAGVDSEANKCQAPLLSKDKVNRVMIYYGSFNPPHVGHLGVLCHAFQSSPDLNIVAGLVYPLDVNAIKSKNRNSNRRLVLSERQRSELWERDARFPTWAFVPRRREYDSTNDFETEIASEAKEDGYEIRYIRVIGPDGWDIDNPRRHKSASYSEYLITDAARRASFVTPDGVPQPVKHYTSWQRLGPDPELRVQLLQQTRPVVEVLESSPLVATAVASQGAVEVESSNSSSSDVSDDSVSHCCSSKSSTAVTGGSTPSSSAEDLGEWPSTTEVVRCGQEDTIWECFEECCHLGVRVRFLCKKDREIGLLGDVTKEISSTALYSIITESSGEDRRRLLQNQVLSPDVFCDFLLHSGFD